MSRDAFNMAYIQLSAQNLQAIVRHGNTLSGEYWEHRPTPQLRLFHQWLERQRRSERLVRAMTDVFEQALSPVPTSPATFFDMDESTFEGLRKKRDRSQPDIVLDRQMELFGS